MKNFFSKSRTVSTLCLSTALLLLSALLFPFSAALAADPTPPPVTSSTGDYAHGLGARPAASRPGGKTITPRISIEALNAAAGPASSLPSKVDYTALVPPVGNQGYQGSCVGWAAGYYYKTMQEYREHGWALNSTDHQFSPSFIYNQINGGYDGGSWPEDAFQLLRNTGDVSLTDFAYNQNDYYSQPPLSLKWKASSYRAKSSAFLFFNESWYPYYVPNPNSTIDLLRQYLALGDAFILTFPVYDSWDFVGNTPTSVATTPNNLNSYRGYHEVTIVGYDDNISSKDGLGAFRVVNQWGTNWGNQGFTWLSYEFVRKYGADASAMTDLVAPDKAPYSVVKDNASVGNGLQSWTLSGTNWKHGTDKSSLSGTISYSLNPGDSLDYAFSGTAISWVGPFSQDAGVAEVYIDGIFQQQIDQWREGDYKPRSLIYHRGDLPLGNHTLRIVTRGSLIEHCPGNWSCLPISTRPVTRIDALLVNASSTDDTEPGLVYSVPGDWTRLTYDLSYNTTESRASKIGSQFVYDFTGTTVSWVGSTGPQYGRADVYLDNSLVASLELYTPAVTRNQVLFSQGALSPSNHSLKVVVRSDRHAQAVGNFVGVDYVMANNL